MIPENLTSRKILQRAEGILISRKDLTSAAAERWIAQEARRTRLSASQIAEQVVASEMEERRSAFHPIVSDRGRRPLLHFRALARDTAASYKGNERAIAPAGGEARPCFDAILKKTPMNIRLTPHGEELLKKQLTYGRYHSPEEVIERALETLSEREVGTVQNLAEFEATLDALAEGSENLPVLPAGATGRAAIYRDHN